MNTTLPARFSERSFRRYEAVIDIIVKQWPLLCGFDPTPLSVETFSCRLRDAIKSLRNNQWQTQVPLHKFIQICDEIVVSIVAKPGLVSVGPEDSIHKLMPHGKPVEDDSIEQIIPKVNVTTEALDLIQAIVVMHHHRILTEPSKITSKTHDILAFQKSYDIFVEKDGYTYTVI